MSHHTGIYLRRAGIILGAVLLAVPLTTGTASADPAPSGTANVIVAIQAKTPVSILEDGSASVYYHGSWQQIDSPNPNNPAMVRASLEPGTYSFAVTLNGTRQQKWQTVGEGDNGVYFHAATMNVELQAHNDSILDIPGNGSASYYAGGWRPITRENANNKSMVQTEMLPGTYSFAATYNGTRDQKQFTVTEPNPNNGTNWYQTVYFHTAEVNVELQGQDEIFDGSASYYAGGWRSITGVNVNNPKIVQAEMLPGTYSFAATLGGTRAQKNYTVIEPNPNNGAYASQIVYFHVAMVSLDLVDHNGNNLEADSATYYAGGWHTMEDGSAAMLPGTYSFATTYRGTREQKQFTVVTPNPNNGANWNQVVNFATSLVDVSINHNQGDTASYYASGWHAITVVNPNNGEWVRTEMLPGTYTFQANKSGVYSTRVWAVPSTGYTVVWM